VFSYGRAMFGKRKSSDDALAETSPGAAAAPSAAGDFSATMAAIAAARERGDLDEVKRLKAEFAAARAEE
jgi:hypothetical protein